MTKRLSLIIITILLIGGVYWYTLQTPENEMEGGIDTSNWETYTNEQFGFSIMHPPEWNIHEAPDDLLTPKFNIYKPESDEKGLPFTHHSQNATHVSIFPQGIPTEGVFGESQNSSVSFSTPVREPRDFLLADGSVWATFAGIHSTSEMWNESGFIFAQVEIQNHETDCLREGDMIPDRQCDPLTGDNIIHHGSINEQDRKIQEAMLASFTLME